MPFWAILGHFFGQNGKIPPPPLLLDSWEYVTWEGGQKMLSLLENLEYYQNVFFYGVHVPGLFLTFIFTIFQKKKKSEKLVRSPLRGSFFVRPHLPVNSYFGCKKLKNASIFMRFTQKLYFEAIYRLKKFPFKNIENWGSFYCYPI